MMERVRLASSARSGTVADSKRFAQHISYEPRICQKGARSKEDVMQATDIALDFRLVPAVLDRNYSLFTRSSMSQESGANASSHVCSLL